MVFESNTPTFCVAVEDGDTFTTTHGTKIKLKDVNVPPEKMSAATIYLESIILDKTVWPDNYDESSGLITANVMCNGELVNEQMREFISTLD